MNYIKQIKLNSLEIRIYNFRIKYSGFKIENKE